MANSSKQERLAGKQRRKATSVVKDKYLWDDDIYLLESGKTIIVDNLIIGINHFLKNQEVVSKESVYKVCSNKNIRNC